MATGRAGGFRHGVEMRQRLARVVGQRSDEDLVLADSTITFRRVVVTDRDDRIVLINPAAERLLGEELLFSKRFAEAETSYREAIRIEPGGARVASASGTFWNWNCGCAPATDRWPIGGYLQ